MPLTRIFKFGVLMHKVLHLYKLWFDEPMLVTSSKFSAFAYHVFKIPPPDLQNLVRMSLWSIYLVGSVFHPIVALPEEKASANAASLMQLCTSLFFIIPAWKELGSSRLEWSQKLYKKAMAEATFRKEQNFILRLVLSVGFLSYIPTLAWVLAFWGEQSPAVKIATVAWLMYVPFAFLSDFLCAAEPPKPDDGDVIRTAIAQPV